MSELLSAIARRCDDQVATARAELVAAVRRASAAGMTQMEIAHEIGRSQAEVNRLLRFHGTSPLAMRLRARAPEVRRTLAEVGGSRVRVFGSVARGEEHDESDIDLLFEMKSPMSLMELSAVERELGELIGAKVDLVPESTVRPDLREGIVGSAVPL